MSLKYAEMIGATEIGGTTSPDMRKYCQRPGRVLEDGKPEYTTEQHHKKECDVNEIIRKYDKTGLISHISRIEARFGDFTGADFKSMRDQVAKATSMFEQLPAKIKNRFGNDPANLLAFMENPENREEGIKLGLIRRDTPEELDGFGEHVKAADDFTKDKQPAAQAAVSTTPT